MPEPLPDRPGEVYRDVNSGPGVEHAAHRLAVRRLPGGGRRRQPHRGRGRQPQGRKRSLRDRLLARGRLDRGADLRRDLRRLPPLRAVVPEAERHRAARSRRRAPTGSAPTPSAATSSAARSTAPGCRWPSPAPSIVIGLFFGGLFGLMAGFYRKQGGLGDLDRHRHHAGLPGPDPGPGHRRPFRGPQRPERDRSPCRSCRSRR